MDDQERAELYRSQTEARISFRANLLRRLAGSAGAFNDLWSAFRPIFDKTNYVQEPPADAGPSPAFDDGGYMTPYDIDDNGAISSSPVRVRNARHASDQNDRPHGG